MPAVSDYSPLDRAYSEWPQDKAKAPTFEEPIVPIDRIGQTVPEQDPVSGANILQNVQAAIRRGAGNMQLVMSVGPESQMGGRFKAYGPEVREEIRTVLEANKVKMSSIELPTAISNLSGYDQQQGAFSDERQERDKQEVRDAIKFAAEVAGGGGVDVLSWEFHRNLSDAEWNRDKKGNVIFETPGGPSKEVVQVVDTVTGRIMQFRKGESQWLPFDPATVDPTKPSDQWEKLPDDKNGLPTIKEWTWDDFVKLAARAEQAGEKKSVTQLFIDVQNNAQISSLKGYAAYYKGIADNEKKRYEAMKERYDKMSEGDKNSDEGQAVKRQVEMEQMNAKRTRDLATGQLQQAKQMEAQSERLADVQDFALERAEESYAELGIAALKETHEARHKGKLETNPIHVGPELGWPQFFGSHPKEFVELIMKSREKMVEMLTDPKRGYGMDEATAQDEARRHIKGVFDTSHLGMFFQNFMPKEPDYQKRIEAFNKWFIDQVNYVAEENKEHDILGNVQLVNSMSGAHGHLPPTQGIFPVVEAGKILATKGGYKGYMTSEGHEEEKFQQGRILLDTWKAFDPNIMGSSGYGGGMAGGGLRWTDVHQSYFGRPYSAMFVFGDYSPSQEFRLWSEIPLE